MTDKLSRVAVTNIQCYTLEEQYVRANRQVSECNYMSEQIDTHRLVLSTAEASKISGFDQTYIQRLLRQERIEGVRVGTVWLVYEDSLRAFMAQPRKRGPKGPRKKSPSEQGSSDETA